MEFDNQNNLPEDSIPTTEPVNHGGLIAVVVIVLLVLAAGGAYVWYTTLAPTSPTPDPTNARPVTSIYDRPLPFPEDFDAIEASMAEFDETFRQFETEIGVRAATN